MLLIAIGALMARGGIADPVDFIVVGLALYDLAMIVMTLIHETAHAITALALGLDVREVSVGIGPRVARWRWWTTTVVLRLFPVTGHTMVLPRGDAIRTKLILVTMAGPMSHVPLAAWLWTVTTGDPIWDALLAPIPVLVLFQMAVNLVPLGENDGRNLWRLMTWPETRVRSAAAVGEAAAAVLSAVENPDSPVGTTHRGALLAHLEVAIDPTERALSLNNLAYLDLLSEDESLIPEAERASREAYHLLPDLAAVRNTRGAVMVMLGQHDEGIRLMRPTMAELTGNDLAESNLTLAYAHASAGRVFEARRHLHAVTGPVARKRLLAETLQVVGRLEAEVVRGFLEEETDPAAAARLFRDELGPESRTTGKALRAHIDATGDDRDLLPALDVLDPPDRVR